MIISVPKTIRGRKNYLTRRRNKLIIEKLFEKIDEKRQHKHKENTLGAIYLKFFRKPREFWIKEIRPDSIVLHYPAKSKGGMANIMHRKNGPISQVDIKPTKAETNVFYVQMQ